MKTMTRATTTLLAALVLVGCGAWGTGEEAAEGGEAMEDATPAAGSALSPAVSAQLDSGTMAYRDGRLDDARHHYRSAVAGDPHAASAWFGVYMVETALENQAAADSALEQLQVLSPAGNPVPPGHTDEAGVPEGGPMNPHAPTNPHEPMNPHVPVPEAGADQAGEVK